MQGFAACRRLSVRLIASLLLFGLLAATAFVSMNQPVQARSSASSPGLLNPNPKFIYVGKAQAAPETFPCQQASAASHCYGPSQIHEAYDIQPVLNAGITGKGQTIVIIDAYQSPTLRHDLQMFDAIFGLPDPTLNILAPYGVPPWNPQDPYQVGWTSEITLDVEWAHAVAPGATIDLVEMPSYDPQNFNNTIQNVNNALAYVINSRLGDAISISLGITDVCVNPSLLSQEHELLRKAVFEGMSVFAATGDGGAAQNNCDVTSVIKGVSSPASDPFVTATGGTTLTADLTTGRYESETTWNEPTGGATGGGFSTVYTRPAYQRGVPDIASSTRGLPDVACDADAPVNGGVLIVSSYSGGGDQVSINGGTSAAAPQWAGIAALAAQEAGHPLGLLNPAIYAIGRSPWYTYAFHDITTGNNTHAVPVPGGPVTIQGYSAHAGWDATTGWGSPDVAHLLSILPAEVAATQDQISQIP